MPSRPSDVPKWDLWPAAQVRLRPTVPKEYSSLGDIDEDPLTYFLTPAPELNDDEGDVEMMDFDAGIESTGRPHEIVRSVSPSSLDGIDRSKSRKASPPVPELSDHVTSETDEDEEEYMRLSSHGLRSAFGRRKPKGGYPGKVKHKNKGVVGLSREELSANLYSTPQPLSMPTTDSRGMARAGRAGRGVAAGRRSHHVWREPSRDVWPIEEEAEDMAGNVITGQYAEGHEVGYPVWGSEGESRGGQSVDVKAAKPKKKVRFALPPEEM